MSDRSFRRLAGVCRCGSNVMLRYGGSGGMDTWDCCSPWQDRATGEIGGYGWDMRSDRESPPESRMPRNKATAPARELHPLLAQISAAPEGMTTCVYERFDEDGVHLYVGISDAPLGRAKNHLKKSTWFQFAASGRERWFASRAEAEAFERGIINARRPIFNRQHARPEAREALIRYLVGKGRFDLIEVTAQWG